LTKFWLKHGESEQTLQSRASGDLDEARESTMSNLHKSAIRIRLDLLSVFVVATFALTQAALTAAPIESNPHIQKLSRLLPVKPMPEEKLKQRFYAVLGHLHSGWLAESLAPRDQFTRATQKFAVSPGWLVANRAAVLDAYTMATSFGLFTPENVSALLKEQPATIQTGPHKGKRCVAAFIIPPDPKSGFGLQFANLQLVPEGAEAALPPPRREAIRQALQSVFDEATEARRARIEQRVEAKQETASRAADWEEIKREAGTAFAQPPKLRLEGQVIETTAKANNQRVRIVLRVNNVSATPTEVALEWFFFARTPRKHHLLLLGSGSRNLQLKGNESTEIEAQSISENTSAFKPVVTRLDYDAGEETKKKQVPPFVNYVGWMARIRHATGIAAATGSTSQWEKFAVDDSKLEELKLQSAASSAR
jgi:uncharacterized membrane protein